MVVGGTVDVLVDVVLVDVEVVDVVVVDVVVVEVVDASTTCLPYTRRAFTVKLARVL